MRVLHIVESFMSGVAMFLQLLVNGMDDEYQSFILYAVRPETPPEMEKLFRPGTVLIRSKHLTREISLTSDCAAFLEIRRVVREVQPDIVHLHSSKAGALGRWAINGRKIPLYYTPHGYSFLMTDGSAAKQRLYFWIEKLCGLRRCTTIACGQGELEQSKRVSKRSICVNNGIDTDELDRLFPNTCKQAGAPSVCTLARITKQKNPELFNQIAKAFPDVKFVWIGDGEMRDVLDSPNIEITGWLPREQALAKMLESPIFLLPSYWEGLPLSLLEAMYLRRVCVVSKISANASVVHHGKTGYFADKLEDYIRILGELVENGVDERVSNTARESVIRDFSKKEMVRKYEQIYEDAFCKR